MAVGVLLLAMALPRAALADSGRAVVFIGGFGSDYRGTVDVFSGLAGELAGRGWAREDLYSSATIRRCRRPTRSRGRVSRSR